MSSQTGLLVSKQFHSGQLYLPLIKKTLGKMRFRLVLMVAPCVKVDSSVFFPTL